VRLALIAAYSILIMSSGFFEWNGTTEALIATAAGLLWIVLLVLLILDLRSVSSARRYFSRRPSLPLLLIAPAFLLIGWWPIVAFVVVVTAYVLELRHHSAGDGFLFSFGLVLFVGLLAALSMVEIENDNEDSSLKTPQDALFWAFASLLRINYGRSLNPETEDGRLLATVVGVCAVLGASLFTATIVAWVVGTRREAEAEAAIEAEEITLAAVVAELEALRAELAEDRAQRSAARPEGTVSP